MKRIQFILVVLAITLAAIFLYKSVRVITPSESVWPTLVLKHGKPEYHICVEQFSEFDNYTVHFTNDNWDTKETIMTAFDISDVYLDGEPHIIVQDILNGNKNVLVTIAKKLKTYEKAVAYNDSVYKKGSSLRQFRIKNPIPKQKPDLEQNRTLTPVCIY